MRPRALLLVFALALAGHFPVAPPLGAQPAQLPLSGCARTPVPGGHIFIAVSVDQGDTLANVLLGQEDSSTVVRVKVSPGDKPISVFVSGYSGTIWDFDGDVGRIRRVFAMSSSRDRRVAVSGIPADRVEFPDGPNCQAHLRAHDPDDLEAQSRALQWMFGRRPDHLAFEHTAHEIALPEAVWNGPPGNARGAMAAHELYELYPGGFRALDPRSLVSPVAIVVPETPPDMAGLMHLERSGAIRKPHPEEVAAWIEGASRPYRSRFSPGYRLRVPFDYAITRDIMLPAGLFGAHGKNFLVLPGVPEPRGHPGHSCVAYMDGFRVGNEMLCLGDERAAIERLRNLPPNDALASCRLVDVPADAAIEAVSAYEPDGAVHSAGSKRVAVPIAVRVHKSGNVVLVLNTNEPAIWRVSFGPDTRIVAVLLGGYHKSELEGVHPDTPVIVTDYEGRAQRPQPDPACESVHGYLTTGYQGGPAAILLDRQIRALTGRGIDGLVGAYKLKNVEIR